MAERNMDEEALKKELERIFPGTGARMEAVKPSKKGFVVGIDGRVYGEDEYNQMTPAQKRGVCVGSTCIHYESDVPGMSDTD